MCFCAVLKIPSGLNFHTRCLEISKTKKEEREHFIKFNKEKKNVLKVSYLEYIFK